MLRRLGLDNPNPYRASYRYVVDERTRELHSYTAHRASLSALYEPVYEALDALEWERLVEPVAGRPTGCIELDNRMAELREAYAAARSADEHKAIGLRSGAILQSLGLQMFDPERHLPPGATVPSRDDAKRRIGFYVTFVTRGRGARYAEIRKLAEAAVRLSEAVKHAPTPSRIDAGIAADATIQVVNLVRRLTHLDKPT